MKICDNLLRTNNAEDDNFIHLKDLKSDSTSNTIEFIKEFVNETEKYNIKETYNNTTIVNYENLNVIKYIIEDLSNTTIIQGFFNIISIKSYNNDNKTDNNLSSLLFGYNNIFTEENNKIILDESKY